MSSWKTTNSKLIHQTPWFKIIEDKVSIPNGNVLTYTYLEKTSAAVAVVAVNESGAILLHKQYLYPLKETLWTLPCGHCDDDKPLKAAQRELFEESGLEGDEWRELGKFYSAAGISKNIGYCFSVHVSGNDARNHDDIEIIGEQRFFSVREIRSMLNNFDITDGFSLVAIYRYLDTLEKQR
ncbi:NUDIX hydrolase [Candidatus Saccharibacteria bacterium]|nr:NUDIX hydrolase [Candidatus Saccharibacteria bacterium]